MSRRNPSRSPSSTVRLPPRAGLRTRRRILAAALRLFSRDGFHGTSVRSLARSVGLTEAALYYHFPSKRAIVEALYEERGFMVALEELEHLPGNIPLGEQLAANAQASARLWDKNADFLRVVIMEVLRGNREAQAVHHELMGRWRRGILDLLTRYQARGEVDRSIDAVQAANTWVYLMFGAFADRLLVLGRSLRRSRFLTPEFAQDIQTLALDFGETLKAET